MRNFITIYTTVSFWEHLSAKDQTILTHLVRICSILVTRIVESRFLQEAHNRLYEILSLIERHYGRSKITPNLHLSLHLAKYSLDYGPLYVFWCFSFEHMNGILNDI